MRQCVNCREVSLIFVRCYKDHSYFYRFQQAEDAKQNRHSSFRKACSCIDKMATLRKVTYQLIEWNTYLYVNFNDNEF